VAKPFSFITLSRFRQDMYAIDARRRALMQSARALLRVDPPSA